MPIKDRAARLEYHRRYFREHREEARESAERRKDAINERRRERHRLARLGVASKRTTHGKTHTVEYALLTGAKKRAKLAGLPFDLTIDDMPTVPGVCPVLGIAIRRSLGRFTDSSPSLDRIRPALGYVQGNVRVVSWRANRIRTDATAAELLLVAEDAARLEMAHA